MAKVIAIFSKPMNSIASKITILNKTNKDIRGFGLSGRATKYPITWDTFGGVTGPVTVTSTNGVDTNDVYVKFNGFDPGEKVSFGLDADFTGDNSSSVRVRDLKGAKAIAQLDNGKFLFGEFKKDSKGNLSADLR
jgi:hypothetical protein